MKYEEAKRLVDGKSEKIDVSKYSTQQLEKMEGDLYCPGDGCMAKLCLVHNSKNGGRTFFLKAVDDEKHLTDCIYKNGNYKATVVHMPVNGYFTEQQINDYVRRRDKEITMPLSKNSKGGKKKSLVSKNKKLGKNDIEIKGTTSKGKIIYGEEGIEGTKGRLSRRFTITKLDIGYMISLNGNIKKIKVHESGEIRICMTEERLENIEILIGGAYRASNPELFERLYVLKKYISENIDKRNLRIVAAGLVTEYNNQLVLELQANGSFRVDGKTVSKMIIDETVKQMAM